MDISSYLQRVPAPVALVTGANKGIGFEIARELAEGGCMVWMTDRESANIGESVSKLEKAALKVKGLMLDTTSAESVAAAALEVEKISGRLDILVNNAGIEIETRWIPGTVNPPIPPSELDMETMRKTYETNVFGPFQVIKALLPLLRKSKAGRIVNASSLLGSITSRTLPNSELASYNKLAYCSSKSALNAITVSFAEELRETGIKVNSACPGYCATDINDNTGPRTAKQGAVTAVRLATLPEDGPTAGFYNDEGPLPW